MKAIIIGIINHRQPNRTTEEFYEAETKLLSAGHDVLNPLRIARAEHFSDNSAWRILITHMMSCDAVFLLPGWTRSAKAKMLYKIANELQLTLINKIDHDGKIKRDIRARDETCPDALPGIAISK